MRPAAAVMELLRTANAARRLGIRPATLRHWADTGRVPVVWVGRERRFLATDLQTLKRTPNRATATGPGAERREALYVWVPGTTGQESSIAAQETELRATATGSVVAVYTDRASGLREDRRGLARLLADAEQGRFTVVRVTHDDRLARFGTGWLRRLLAAHGVAVEVLHTRTPGGHEELLADFMALVATFSGRLYGLRSAAARQRLLRACDTATAGTGGHVTAPKPEPGER